MNLRPLLPLLLAGLALPVSLHAQRDEGTTLQPLAPANVPATTPTPADPVPPALAADLTAFAKEELAAEQQDDFGKLVRFYDDSVEDEGRPVDRDGEFKRAWADYTRRYTRRTLETLSVRFLAYDPAAGAVELQQTYGSETQPQGEPDREKKLFVRQLRVVRAGRGGGGVIARRFTVKEFWTYDARLSENDHYQPSQPRRHLADEFKYDGGVRGAVNAIVLQDRANYYSGRKDGRDPDDEPCAYFDDPAHRALLSHAKLKLIPDTPATLEAILHGTPRVRVSFSDNLRGENRDGYPVLNVGVLER